MRQPLHHPWNTFMHRRGAPIGWGGFAFVCGSVAMINARVPFILIVAFGLVIGALMALVARRFEPGWLNGYFDGSGQRTLEQLRRLIREARVSGNLPPAS